MTVAWDYDLAVGDVDLAAHTGLLLAEDDGLKSYLSGITVPEKEAMVPVEVYFRYPEGERKIKYPFITIDFLAIDPSYERWTSQWKVPEDYCLFLDPETGETVRTGMYIPSVSDALPTKTGSDDEVGFHIDPYLMYTLTYQVAVYSRAILHDRYLASRFMTDILPPRPFFIGVDADMTWRRCELLDMQPADTTEVTDSGNKRIFRKIYTITMDAEIPLQRIYEVRKATRLHIDVYPEPTPPLEPSDHRFSDEHDVAEPVTLDTSTGRILDEDGTSSILDENGTTVLGQE